MKVITTHPTDRYSNLELQQIQNTTNPYVLHIWDVCEEDYIYWVNKLQNPPKYIVNDSLNLLELSSGHCYSSNWWLEKELSDYKNFLYCSDTTTNYIFNFMINKKQINRFLCMKLVEYFNLKDFTYTWSGIGNVFDMTEIISERSRTSTCLSDDFYSEILSPIKTINQNFNMPIGVETNVNNMVGNKESHGISNYGYNWQVWDTVVKTKFETSAISLITESIQYSKSICFSEKTLFSVLGLSFPIWIGGYKQADEWRKSGFDTFDDIINHDYQYYDTLIERCYYAFKNNLDLLTNKEKISNLRNLHRNRLIRNRELILNNQLDKFNNSQFQSWPVELQTAILPLILAHFK
jgi:hypothetical protein